MARRARERGSIAVRRSCWKVKGQGRDCAATFGMGVGKKVIGRTGGVWTMQTVRSPICQRNASIALRLCGTALPPFFFLFILSCTRVTCPRAPLCPLLLCTSLHSDLRYKGRDNNNNNSSIEAVVFFVYMCDLGSTGL